MAGWSLFSDGSSPDPVEIIQNLRKNGICPDSDKDSKFKCMFDRILSVFLEEIYQKREILPLPVMLGDGQCVDLFKLYWVVRKKGGYDSVTESGLWGQVSDEAGMGADFGTPMKLIYKKYLEPLDRWLRVLEDKGITRDSAKGRIEVEARPVRGNVHVNGSLKKGSLKKGSVRGREDGVMVLVPCVANGVCSSIKRKRERECLFGMLNWVKRMAKNPGHPYIRRALEGSKWTAPEMEYWKQALIVRKALFLRRRACSSVVRSLMQKRQKMHPSMYEDFASTDNRSTEKLRCSQRLHFLHKRSRSGSYSETSRALDNDSDKYLRSHVSCLENDPDEQLLRTLGSLSAETVVGLFCKDQMQKRVPVGPLFQAEVPNWTGIACDSDDSKWLGTQHWPPELKELKLPIEKHPIGKGRPDSCGCKLPGSVKCVRFHVAEKRFQLKLELGSAFYKWRFDHMGEEVSLSWTVEEERRFKAIVYRNPLSLDKCFWDEACISFHSKSRRGLVSYYFNVFLARRRSYQNRVTPNRIDSDDEESEFGFVSSGFGHDAVKVLGFKSVLCAQNKQCLDLDESTDVD